MPRKTTHRKLAKTVLLSIDPTVLDELESVSTANDCSIQELFRRAARAIVRCHHELGEVPMDMRLVQRRLDTPHEDSRGVDDRMVRAALAAQAIKALKSGDLETSHKIIARLGDPLLGQSPSQDPSVNEAAAIYEAAKKLPTEGLKSKPKPA